MPTSPPRLCPSCRQPVRGRCPRCTKTTRRRTDQYRGSSNSRGYGYHWRVHVRLPFLRDNPLCVLCGALANVADHWPITRAELVERGVPDPDAPHRLRSLCDSCHNIHGLNYHPGRRREHNDLVTVVAGPPCAGKNTWVEQHRQPGDVVVDFDQIMAAMSGRPLREHDVRLRGAVNDERDHQIRQLLASGKRGWIIATAPKARQRHTWHCNVVLLLPSQAVAMRRAAVERPEAWRTYVQRWYADYEPDDRDTLIPT